MAGKNPGRTPEKEVEERVDYTVTLLKAKLYPGEIKKVLKGKYGVSARTCENYLSRARQILIEETDKTKEEHIADAYVTYNKVLRSKASSDKDKLLAQNSLNKLLGLNMPLTVAQTDTKGNDIEPDATAEDQLLALIDAVNERNGKAGGDSSSGKD